MASNRFGKKTKKETSAEKKERKEKKPAHEHAKGAPSGFNSSGGAQKLFQRRTAG